MSVAWLVMLLYAYGRVRLGRPVHWLGFIGVTLRWAVGVVSAMDRKTADRPTNTHGSTI